MCPDCNGRGWIVRQYVLFSDGSYSEVEQISERCACNPVASDEELPDWQDVPELWGQSYPGIDYDAPIRDSRSSGR